MRSADVHNLQFETTEDGHGYKTLIPGSERLTCPKCHREHAYKEARDMNIQGGYIHKNDSLINIRTGFQWGALASQWSSLNWTYIAEKQLLAGKSAGLREQAYFDNSIRGLPFRPRREAGDEKEQLYKHCSPAPDPANAEALFLIADTQDDGFRWGLFLFDLESNRYLVDFGNAPQVADLQAVFDGGWNGLTVTMAMVDEGGHRKAEVVDFVEANQRAFSYKGGWKGGFDAGRAWAWSKNQPKLILARRDDYQDALLYYLHFQKQGDKQFFFLPPEERLTVQIVDELLSVKENPRKREGHLRKNWSHDGRVHDYFDVYMMYFVIEDVACCSLDINEFRYGKADLIIEADAEPEVERPKSTGFVAGSGRNYLNA